MPGGLAEVPVGYRAGGWEVVARIASGSWASVYAARRLPSADGTNDTRTAALKFLPGTAVSPLQFDDLREAIRAEVRFHELVKHPLLIRTYETFVIDDPGVPALHGAVVIAMERAASSLADLLDTVAPPDPVPGAARIVAQLCEALLHLHEQGWVHGDIKPGNVLLMPDGSVRLGDFGLSRELVGTHAYAPRLGSPDFLPPEWWSERIGVRGITTRTTVDVWALGVTAHQLLTGGLYPFPGVTARARGAAAQAYADGQSDLRLADGLSPGWRRVIADCLARDHSSRMAHSAATLLPRIRALASDHGRSPDIDPVPRAARLGRFRHHRPGLRRWLWGSATVAAALATMTTMRADRALPPLPKAPMQVYNAESAFGAQPVITRQDQTLMRAGQPWKFAGLNADTWFGCWDGEAADTTDANLDRYFRELNPHSLTRVWAYAHTDWRPTLTRITTAAQRHGQYLMVTLSDANKDGDKGDGYQCGSNKGPGYPADGGAVKTHAVAVASAFRASPAIAAWEIINGGTRDSSARSWYRSIGEAIKAADPDTLLASGAGTCYESDWAACVVVDDFAANDIITLHEFDWNNGGVSHWADETANIARRLNRPWYVAGAGFCCTGRPPNLSEDSAARALRDEWNAYLNAQGSSGMLYWDFKWRHNNLDTINFGDPAWTAASTFRHQWHGPTGTTPPPSDPSPPIQSARPTTPAAGRRVGRRQDLHRGRR